ncbi:NINE protein [Variovorax sp. VNK109]|uniref:TM2 domain-containing protein n=1 Tax=Variovorax sp. VNK109 TaxID=3400919 RepID=UPI003C101569
MKTKGPNEKYCAECGAIIRAKAEICPHCGVRQMAVPDTGRRDAPKSERSKLVAGLLAIFLGGFGVHKFYLGRLYWGIFYLIFCWTFVPAVIGFLEGLNYLLMSQATFDKRYQD